MKSYSPHLRRIQISAWASFLVILVGLSGDGRSQAPQADNSSDEGIVRQATSGGVIQLAPGLRAQTKTQPKLTGVVDQQQQSKTYRQVKEFQPAERQAFDHSMFINTGSAPLIRAANPLNIVSASETKTTVEVVPVKKSEFLPKELVTQRPIERSPSESRRVTPATNPITPAKAHYPIFDITQGNGLQPSSRVAPSNNSPSTNSKQYENLPKMVTGQPTEMAKPTAVAAPFQDLQPINNVPRLTVSNNNDVSGKTDVIRDTGVPKEHATQLQIDLLKTEIARMREESRSRDEALTRSAEQARNEARAREEARERNEARAREEARSQEEARARYEAQMRYESQARNNAARMQHAPVRVGNAHPPLVVRAGAEFDGANVLQQPDNAEPLPLNKLAAGKEPVSMHLKNADVREALEMLSRSHGINILVAPNVTGSVTVNLENVPVDQAISGIMKLCNLAANYEDGMIFVYAAASLPRKDMRVQVFTLDYASAKDVLPTVTALISEGGNAFISAIKPDDNRQTKEAVVVADTQIGLERVAEYIRQMDTPPMQVMIEAHVLEVQLGDDYVHGVNYKGLLGQKLELEMTDFANPMAAPALFARVTGGDIDALVEFLQTTGDTKTLASPRVMVLNGQTARIQVGQQLGFRVTTVTETAAVETIKFLEVGVLLQVTPTITRDGRVMMRVKPEVSSGQINPTTSLPEEDTRELESDVLLMDGQGVVIGGLIQEKDVSTRKKVPWLGDLYIVGKLFQRVELKKSRTEIVITLVPRIVQDDMMTTEQDAINVERSMTPIFHGPLRRLPRPWDPSMPDPINNPGPTIPRL